MEARVQLVGREAELLHVDRLLGDVGSGPCAVVLYGDPGIGKSTLWKEGVARALDRSFLVLNSRGAASETALSYAGLGDLLSDRVPAFLSFLPEPQREAILVATLRARADRAPDRRTVALAALSALRVLSAETPVLIAIDDLQWLDGASRRAMEFVSRRLRDERVGLLLTIRTGDEGGDPTPIAPMFEPGWASLEVGPLSRRELGRLIRARVDASISTERLVGLHRASGGNPFYALEIARALLRRRESQAEPLPIPGTLKSLVRERLQALPPAVRSCLAVAASVADPTVELVRGVVGERTARGLTRAEDDGIISVAADRISFAHPLLAASTYAELTPARRRRLHARVAEVVSEPEERGRHVALSSPSPGAKVAGLLDEAAAAAHGRGAPEAAAELAGEARRLTVPGAKADGWRRGVQRAQYLFEAGDATQARTVLQQLTEEIPASPLRARALRLLGETTYHTQSWDVIPIFRQALEESGDDLELQSELHLEMVLAALIGGDLIEAKAHAADAARGAELLGHPDKTASALAVSTYLDFLAGSGLNEAAMRSALTLESEPGPTRLLRPSVVVGTMLKLADRYEEARNAYERAHTAYEQTGDEAALAFLLFHMSELETWAGNLDLAETYALEGDEIAERTHQATIRAGTLYMKAFVHGLRGAIEAAQAEAELGLAIARETKTVPAMLFNTALLGFLDLSVGDPAAAVQRMNPLAQQIEIVGLGEPGVVRFVPDHVEALISSGCVDQARPLLESFWDRAVALNRKWALATGARCRGLLLAVTGDLEGADAALQRSVEYHARLGNPFELGRTLLVRGTVLRKAKQKKRARQSLEDSLVIFRTLGIVPWAARAETEMQGIGKRSQSARGLTPAEGRIADLVASGHTNQEIASRLFLSTKTVERNLTRIYAKLAIRSRTELTRMMLAQEHSTQP